MSVITRRSLLVSLALASAAAAGAADAAPRKGQTAPARWKPIDDAIDQAIKERAIPGAAVRITRDGAVLYSRTAGLANLETNAPVTEESVFRIGSVSKQFTAAAILLLQEDGKLSVDDPLARFIPDFPRADQIMLRRMLNHTSGLGNYTAVKPEIFLQNSRLDYDETALLKVMRDTDPLFLFEPGTGWRYSNNDYVLLGIVVARASGQSYSTFLKSRIFEPLGLKSTAADDAADVVPHRSSGYTADKSAPSGFQNASFISMTYPGGAGALRSSASDLCRWSEALLGGHVLNARSLEAMLTPARLKDGSLPAPSPRAPPGSTGARYGFGLGFDNVRGHREVSHQGGIQGFYSDLRAYPDLDVHIAVLVNSDGTSGARPSSNISSAAMKLVVV